MLRLPHNSWTIAPPRSKEFDDIYFSPEDGLAETRHVFLGGNDLPARFQGRDRFTIAETGFGTGLNFLAAWTEFSSLSLPLTPTLSPMGRGKRAAGAAGEGEKRIPFLDFISIEKYPLSKDEIRTCLAPWESEIGRELEQLLSQYPPPIPGFHRLVFENAVLTLVFGDVNEVLPQLEASVDCWFLDGFKPSSNPEMWSATVFENMARLSAPGATFATFTAAGAVKRGLTAAGFEVRKVKGFGRKRDMLAGVLK